MALSPPLSKNFGSNQQVFEITPDDLAFLDIVPDYLYIGTGGTISIATPGTPGPISVVVQAGRVDLSPTRIFATGTSGVANIVGVKNGPPVFY